MNQSHSHHSRATTTTTTTAMRAKTQIPPKKTRILEALNGKSEMYLDFGAGQGLHLGRGAFEGVLQLFYAGVYVCVHGGVVCGVNCVDLEVGGRGRVPGPHRSTTYMHTMHMCLLGPCPSLHPYLHTHTDIRTHVCNICNIYYIHLVTCLLGLPRLVGPHRLLQPPQRDVLYRRHRTYIAYIAHIVVRGCTWKGGGIAMPHIPKGPTNCK